MNLNKFDEAEQHLRSLKKSANLSNNYVLKKYLAICLCKLRKEEEEAETLLRECFKENANDSDVCLELSQLLEVKKPQQSVEFFAKLLTLIQENPNEERMYAVDSNLIEIITNYAAVKIRSGSWANVTAIIKDALSRILKALPTADEEETMQLKMYELINLFNLGLFYECSSCFDAAYSYYKKLIQTNPSFIDAYVRLAAMFRNRGNFVKATEYLDRGLAASKSNNEYKKFIPRPTQLFIERAHLCLAQGNREDALEVLTDCISKVDSRDSTCLVLMGNIYYDTVRAIRQGATKEILTDSLNKALEKYIAVLEKDKFNTCAAVGVANVFAEYNAVLEAEDTYKAVNEKKEDISCLYNEALICFNLGKIEMAIRLLKKALKIEPNDKNLLLAIAKVYLDSKKFEDSLIILRKLRVRYPNNPFYIYNYAVAAMFQGVSIVDRGINSIAEGERAHEKLKEAKTILTALKTNGKNFAAQMMTVDNKAIFVNKVLEQSVEFVEYISSYIELAAKQTEKSKHVEEESKTRLQENKTKYSNLLVLF